jgi:hypothetical protein
MDDDDDFIIMHTMLMLATAPIKTMTFIVIDPSIFQGSCFLKTKCTVIVVMEK